MSGQATFNLLDQSALPMLEAAAQAGVWVIVKEALANGRLTSRAADAKVRATLAAEATVPLGSCRAALGQLDSTLHS
jgi:aryl-alcohol dehydrogenase-like predicted oxidoreductase